MPRRLDDQSGGSDDRRDAPEANHTLDSWKEIGDFLGAAVEQPTAGRGAPGCLCTAPPPATSARTRPN